MTESIQVENIEVRLKGETVLHDLSFSLDSGEMLGVIGRNGVGKSTLLKVILGLIHPENGTVRIEGKRKRTTIGYVPQSRAIDDEMPIQTFDFIALGLPQLIRPWLTKRDRAMIKEVMALTNATFLANKPLGTLSGGERQRVFLAQALARNPKVLLLDEATSNLDPEAQEQIASLVHRLCMERKIGVLFISHDLELVQKYAHRVLWLRRDGYKIGKTDEILENIIREDTDLAESDRSEPGKGIKNE